ncbi:MAG: 2-amino-4-hydroxy-6-hydroxymethyldihydropteridine diphosphokinase [Gammaproteobacteria bacterium]|nr:2-amino-4-hydroxy-6-hydroxymethyldihydropteridine diphosphokinase [Gammaproteobacteria bacterium]MBL6999768.1 2-amino-4-hydroxy-6-hydroxymethyldihydropteridine diphosphokinase [Gammaproteobacteria bacterium]
MQSPAVKTYIGIGSNLADPKQQVIDVLPHLNQISQTRLLEHSSLYQSAAVSEIEQEDYINAVACLETQLTPEQLLLELQAIEYAFYRQRSDELKWAPRTMDLDIILYGNLRQRDSHLSIPHDQLQNRLFVLQPLQEIAGDLYLPGLGSLSYMIQHAPSLRIEKLA